MSAQPAVESVVLVERFDNVVQLTWVGAPARPPITFEPPAVGGGSTCRRATFRRCWRRSQLRRDLIEWGWLIGLLAAVVIGMAAHDHITQLAHTLTGGTP